MAWVTYWVDKLEKLCPTRQAPTISVHEEQRGLRPTLVATETASREAGPLESVHVLVNPFIPGHAVRSAGTHEQALMIMLLAYLNDEQHASRMVQHGPSLQHLTWRLNCRS